MRRFTPFILSTVSLAALAATPAFAKAQPNTPAPPNSTTPLPDQANPPPCPPGTVSTNGSCVTGQITTAAGAPANQTNSNAIVVTGTRIQRPNLQSPVPITSVTQAELTNQSQVSVGDALNDLPAFRSTFSQQNSGRFIGSAGQNFLDLRGLSFVANSFADRTLVLVNGRRFITGSVGQFSVDVDNIPQDLIDRIDIVTGGESAVYGSDAIAGVVNFILKKDFDGFRIRGQAGESKYGDRPIDFVSTTFGKNFADGRGNIAANLEFTHAGELFIRDRAHFSNVCGFEPNPADNGGAGDPTTATGDNTNGIPDNIFVCNQRFPFVTNGGQVALLTLSGRGLAFDPTGNLVITPPCDQSFIAFQGTCTSSNPLVGSTLVETGDLAVGRNRYSASLLGHFDVSDVVKPFIEAEAIHQNVFQEGQPTFFAGDLHTFFEGGFGAKSVPSLSCNNGFLTQQNLQLLDAIGFCAPGANGFQEGTLPLDRFNVDLGARKEVDHRKTYRVVAGTTGDFNTDWHYEVSFNYGHTNQINEQHNDLFVQNPDGSPGPFSLAIDAVAVLNGQIVPAGTPGATIECRSTLTNPGNGCVPLDLFGEGKPSQAAINFVNRTSALFQTATEQDALGFLSGTTSKWFSLPGGPVGFSIGLEHRRETAQSHADAISSVPGDTFFNAFAPFNPPPFKVSEAFGELSLPILKDLPFAHELTVSGAARYSHYDISDNRGGFKGNTFTWNANAIWAPTPDLRLRANISKAVRVPTLNDLFSPPSVNFGFVRDPCDQQFIGQNPNRAANCAAAGVPTTVLPGSPCEGPNSPVGSPFHNCVAATQTIQFTSAGNPNLTPETAHSLTAGGVFTPRFLPGFSFSADYFRINVTNLIAVLGAQTILNSCFDAPSLNNNFCPLIHPRSPFGLFATPALLSAGVNFARVITRGIDFDLSYRHTFANGNRIDIRGIATDTLTRTNFIDPTDPNLGIRQLSTLGTPHFSGTLITNYGIGKFNLRWTTRYIGSTIDTVPGFAFEDTHQQPDACTTTGGVKSCPPFNSDIADHPNTGAVWYHDVRVDYTIHKYNFYVGIDNLFNRLPPLGIEGVETGGAGAFSNFGRYFYAGAVIDLK
ncbi:MAG TPA: TonB-dependent receptor [Sphingomicrobium sp.]|nr:TonB-dependent receptor [Sphingomicrobium sp.]